MIVNIFAFLFAAALGIGLCFLGYRVFLVLLPIWGFFSGFWFGAFSVSQFLGGSFLATTTGWVVGAILGVLFAVVSYYIFLAGVALVAAAIGAALSYGVMLLFMEPNFIVSIITVVIAVLFAVITLRHNLQKYVIIALTAFSGADLLVLSLLILFGVVPLLSVQESGNLVKIVTDTSWIAWLGWIALAAGGIYFQIVSNKDYEFTKDRYVEGWG